MNITKYSHWLLYPLFLLACARQTSPTGGPKDTIPPILTASLPADGETNFNSRQIELLFNEDVMVNNPKEELIITPDIGKDYEINARKNKVIIKLASDLKDTTTYAFKFREGIQDLTERNSPRDLKLAFSTGDFIDSLSFSGIVYDPLTAKENKDITVAIYQQDTFNIFQHRPVYFSKTDDKGNFTIANLKPGSYRIYAFDDKNKNLIVDSKTERYGFLSDQKTLRNNINSIAIPTVRLDARPLKITSARPSATYYNIKTTKSLQTFSIRAENRQPLYTSFGEDNANVRIYNNLADADSISIRFIGIDSIENKIDTTVYLKFTKRNLKPEAFKVTATDFQVLAHKGILSGTLQFNKPIIQINYDSILYRIDSANVIRIQPTDISFDTIHNKLTIQKTFDKTLLAPKVQTTNKTEKIERLKEAKQKTPVIRHQLYIAPASFISIEADSSKRIAQTVDPLTLESTGVLHVQIDTSEPNYIVQLLNKQNDVLQSKVNTPKASFEDLNPGDYQLRVIIDLDANRKWTPGNFLENTEPEPIHFYKNEKGSQILTLKANWELGPLLIKI